MADLNSTLAERGARYGDFTDHARVSQTLKNVILERLGDRQYELPFFVLEGIGMVCHKLGRIANGDPLYADSWHDIAGYATLVEQRLQPPVIYSDASKLTPPMEVPPDVNRPRPAVRSESAPEHGRCNCPTCNPDESRSGHEPAGPGHPVGS